MKHRHIEGTTRKAIITLQDLPSQRYRRQAVKDDLDIVGLLLKYLSKNITYEMENTF